MRIRADKRCIEARREPDAEACITAGVAELRDLQIRLAKCLARIDASAHAQARGLATLRFREDSEQPWEERRWLLTGANRGTEIFPF